VDTFNEATQVLARRKMAMSAPRRRGQHFGLRRWRRPGSFVGAAFACTGVRGEAVWAVHAPSGNT